jgi:dUTP pyrophosphatase
MVLDYALTVSVNQKVPVLIVAEEGFEPIYAQPGDAGADLRSKIDAVVPANSRVLVPTGVSIALPAGFVGLVHPRSGLAHKHGITVLNAPGTVDSGYRGEISVNLFNTSNVDFEIVRGDRIAQLVIQKYEEANFVKVDRLPDSDRGQAGHGSTGKK